MTSQLKERLNSQLNQLQLESEEKEAEWIQITQEKEKMNKRSLLLISEIKEGLGALEKDILGDKIRQKDFEGRFCTLKGLLDELESSEYLLRENKNPPKPTIIPNNNIFGDLSKALQYTKCKIKRSFGSSTCANWTTQQSLDLHHT